MTKKFFSAIELILIKNSIRNSGIEETPKKLDFSYLTFFGTSLLNSIRVFFYLIFTKIVNELSVNF